MLLRTIFQNFLSFDEPVQFDMFPNPKRETFQNHIYNYNTPLLKQAAIYGANGSGKSNFIEGIGFLKKLVIDKNFLKEVDVQKTKFRLSGKQNNEPITLLVEFLQQTKYFIYTIKINTEGIEQEELYLSELGKKDNKLIFSRVANTLKVENTPIKELQEATTKLLKSNPQTSLLALNIEFPVIQDDNAKIAYNWFKQSIEVIGVNSKIPLLIDIMYHNQKLLNFTKNIFSKIDIGIDDILILSEPFDKWITRKGPELKKQFDDSLEPNETISQMQNNKNLYSVSIEKGIKTVHEFIFKQLGKKGYIGDMDIIAQSDGTVRLLTLLPAIFSAIEENKVIVIDEIENSIHPILISELIKYYSSTKTKGQLIFSTHETCLLSQQRLLRPDEVWFAQKHEGATKMYSLNDYKVHHTISIENGYLQGRYGAIPFIGSLEE